MCASRANSRSLRRSACDRCRVQKLKCAKDDLTDEIAPCRRCFRLGAACVTGPELRPGRPAIGRALKLSDSGVTHNGNLFPREPTSRFIYPGMALSSSSLKELSTPLVKVRGGALHGAASAFPSISKGMSNRRAMDLRSAGTELMQSDVGLASARLLVAGEDSATRRTENTGFLSTPLHDATRFLAPDQVLSTPAVQPEIWQSLDSSPQWGHHTSQPGMADYAETTAEPFDGVLCGSLTSDLENWLPDSMSTVEDFSFVQNDTQMSEPSTGMQARFLEGRADSVIQQLSDLNLRIYKQLDQIEDHGSNFSLATIICVPFHDGNRTSPLFDIMLQLSQDFLKLLGNIKPLTQLQPSSPHLVHIPAKHGDLPITLIIVSCYFQIITIYSLLFSHISRSLADFWPPSGPLSLPSLSDIHLGPFELSNGNIQSMFLVQLIRYVLLQIERALGPPIRYQLRVERKEDIGLAKQSLGGLFKGEERYFELADIIVKGTEKRPFVTGPTCSDSWKDRLHSLGLDIRAVEERLRDAI